MIKTWSLEEVGSEEQWGERLESFIKPFLFHSIFLFIYKKKE